MEENRYGINWLGLFIKVIVFVVVVLLAIWLISKITLRNKGLSFDENNQKFQDASVEYFKKNLPEKNDTLTVTLNQLISWDYLEKLKNEDGKTCDVKNSKSKIEIIEDYYSIKTILVCGNKSETNYIKLGNEKCTNCDIKVKGLKEPVTEILTQEENKTEQTNENTTTNEDTSKGTSKPNNSSNQNVTNNNSNKTILYEYVKEEIEYSDWYVGKVTGTNIENSTKNVSYSNYCKNETYTYRSLGYVTEKMNYSFKLELVNLENKDSLKLVNIGYYENLSDYQRYINKASQDLDLPGANPDAFISLPSASKVKESSLKSNNFSFSVSSIYEEKEKYYVDIKVNVKNLTGIKPYYASNIKSNIYYVPIKFTVSYVDNENCVTDTTENANKYTNYTITKTWNKTIDIYRYKLITKESIYSATPVEGYIKTGKTKFAS